MPGISGGKKGHKDVFFLVFYTVKLTVKDYP
jgi:hypothetical protein